MKFLNFFLVGFIILVGAILINLLSSLIGLTGWYAFIQNIVTNGLKQATKEAGFFSLTFMLILYPFLLGLLGHYGAKINRL